MVAKFEKFKGKPKTPKELLDEALPKAILISAVEKEVKMKPFEE